MGPSTTNSHTQLQPTTLSNTSSQLHPNFKPTPSRCSSPPSLLSSLPLLLPAPRLSRPARSTHPAQLPPRVTTSGRSPTSSDASLREPTTTASASTSRLPTEVLSTSTALPRPTSLRTTSSTLAARTASSTSL